MKHCVLVFQYNTLFCLYTLFYYSFLLSLRQQGIQCYCFQRSARYLQKKKEHIKINFSALKILSHLQGGKIHIFTVKMKENISAISVKSGSR